MRPPQPIPHLWRFPITPGRIAATARCACGSRVILCLQRRLSNRMLQRSSLIAAASQAACDSPMSLAPRTAGRMQAVQTPVIPVVGDLVRSTPGAISLGQGVVYYGPPPEALAAAQQFGAKPQDHKYHAVGGITELVDLIS